MTTTINASPTNGIVQTADGSGVLKVQSNGKTTNALAWVNFNGVTTTSIRSSYNVSSITRSSAGTYVVNFSNALSDANYCAVVSSDRQTSYVSSGDKTYNYATSSVGILHFENNAAADVAIINVAIFGN